jgi:predicted amidophosphoribosyltransferase
METICDCCKKPQPENAKMDKGWCEDCVYEVARIEREHDACYGDMVYPSTERSNKGS